MSEETISITDAMNKLAGVMNELNNLLDLCGYRNELVTYNLADPQECFMMQRLDHITKHLEKVSEIMNYLERPVTDAGTLFMSPNGKIRGRSATGKEWEYSCGSDIEFLTSGYAADEYGDDAEVLRWETSDVGFSNGRYFINGWPEIEIEGLTVRRRM